MPRVLICDKLEAPGLDLLRQAGIELDERHGLTGSELQTAIRAADGIIVRSGTRITADLIEDAGKLRAIVRAGVGVGGVGREVAKRAAGLDMKIVGFDPFLPPAGAAQIGVETAADLVSLLPRCDFITVHTPLTEETRGLIGAKELALLPRGARVL